MATKVDMNDPNMKRIVYNMYRGMLGTYNDKANGMIDAMPKKAVKEDQGISKQIESMLRQSSQISGGGSPSPGIISDGGPVNAAPTFAAPPPPPPPGPGTLPTVRLSTEIPESSRVKEPPAAVMNAMMSKDKKPFTYTPGGLDLSQIRSPRMQRRITRNAAAEGVAEQPAKAASSLAPALATPAMHPQIAVPVFPPPPPPPPPQNGMNNKIGAPMPPPPPPSNMEVKSPPSQQGSTIGGHIAGHPQIVIPKNPVLRSTGLRTDKQDQESYVPPVQQQAREPVNNYPPPQLERQQVFQDNNNYGTERPSENYAPQNYSQQRPSEQQQNYAPQRPSEQQQNYAPRPSEQQQNYQRPSEPTGSVYVPPVTSRAQLGSLYIPPVAPVNDGAQRQTPQTASASPVQLNKAPTPWMSQQKQAPQVPAWAARDDAASPSGTRIIPIQIEGQSPPPQQQQQYQQQQQQYQQQQYQQQQQQQQFQQPRQAQPQQPPGTRIIPIQVEGASSPTPQQQYQQQQQQQPQHRQQRTVQPVYVHNKFNPSTQPAQQYSQQQQQPQQQQQQPPQQQQQQKQQQQPEYNPSDPRTLQQQMSWSGAPVQSRSFRVLQKMTDTEKEGEEEEAQEYPAAPGNHWSKQQQQQGNQPQQWGQQQVGQDHHGPQWGPQNTQGVPVSQLRKMQLNDDDRALMNKFKAQVDEETFLHTEEDPRYRGAAIPSRAFRMLQTMTDTAGDNPVPRGPTPVQQRMQQAQAEAPAQPYIPASEQQVQEPRKYTGGAIPSRSFRMLQAMTAPENCGGDQSDM